VRTGQRGLAAGDEMIGVPRVGRDFQRSLSGIVPPAGRAGQQEVDGVGNELDVPVLLSCDVGDEVVERSVLLASAKGERLEGVVNGYGVQSMRPGRTRIRPRSPI